MLAVAHFILTGVLKFCIWHWRVAIFGASKTSIAPIAGASNNNLRIVELTSAHQFPAAVLAIGGGETNLAGNDGSRDR